MLALQNLLADLDPAAHEFGKKGHGGQEGDREPEETVGRGGGAGQEGADRGFLFEFRAFHGGLAMYRSRFIPFARPKSGLEALGSLESRWEDAEKREKAVLEAESHVKKLQEVGFRCYGPVFSSFSDLFSSLLPPRGAFGACCEARRHSDSPLCLFYFSAMALEILSAPPKPLEPLGGHLARFLWTEKQANSRISYDFRCFK